MNQRKAALKARLMTHYEAQQDALLEHVEDQTKLTLNEIEELALQTRYEVGQAVTQGLVELESKPTVPGPSCPVCQAEMHYKGNKHKRLRSRSGEVDVERPYYYCASCRQGCFPPG